MESLWVRLSGCRGLAQLPCGPLLHVLHGFSAWGGQSLTRTQFPEVGNPFRTNIFVYLQFLLKCSWVTMLWYFLLYKKVHQLYRNICPLLLSFPPTLTPIPALWVSAECQAELSGLYSCFPLAIRFTHGTCIYGNATLSIHPTLSLLPCVHKPILYACVSIPALQIGSSVLFFFFWFLHIYALPDIFNGGWGVEIIEQFNSPLEEGFQVPKCSTLFVIQRILESCLPSYFSSRKQKPFIWSYC